MPIDMKRGQATAMEGIMAAKAPRLRPEIIFQISFSFERKLRRTLIAPIGNQPNLNAKPPYGGCMTEQ
jgi:hypothetical protein